jgi:hypothetical protein
MHIRLNAGVRALYSLVEENTKLGEVRGNAPDLEKQPPITPRTPKNDLTIRPHIQLVPRKLV